MLYNHKIEVKSFLLNFFNVLFPPLILKSKLIQIQNLREMEEKEGRNCNELQVATHAVMPTTQCFVIMYVLKLSIGISQLIPHTIFERPGVIYWL